MEDKFQKAQDDLLFKLDIDGVLHSYEMSIRELKLMKYMVDHGKVISIPNGRGEFSYYRET